MIGIPKSVMSLVFIKQKNALDLLLFNDITMIVYYTLADIFVIRECLY